MAKVNKSRIIGKIKKRSKGAWKKSRGKAASARGQQLPGGIVRGVAQFSSFNIDENDNKVPFISLTGIVKEPEEYRGARATVTHRFEETENDSIESKMDKFSSDLQLLGSDTEGTTEDDWDGLLAELVKDKPHFYFNTRAWSFTGRDGSTIEGTTVFIQGLAEDWDGDDDEVPNDDEDPDEDGADNDPDDEEPEDDEDGDDYEPAKDDRVSVDDGENDEWDGTVKTVNKRNKTATVLADEDDETYSVDWDSMTPLEDDEDGEDEDDEPEDDEDPDEDPDDEGDDDGEEDPDDEDGDDEDPDDDEGDDNWVPDKGDVYLYSVNNRAKAREVDVTSVNKSKETVNVKRVDDGKVFKDVPWTKLQGAD